VVDVPPTQAGGATSAPEIVRGRGAGDPAPVLESAGGAADTAPGSPRPRVSLPYVAGFDGIRGFGVILMLLGHHGWPKVPGALFTVSMFFTLSGFLIATLMLGEWARSDGVSLSRFWERRARRLLPAALVTITGIVALQYWFEVGSGPRFRGDVISAVGYVTNWRMAFSGTDYAANFAMESPVQHFWSLAIEEQFYLVFPLAFLGLVRLTRGRWGLLGAFFGVAAVASFAAAWVSAGRHGNSGLTYYATYTRVSEILAGVVLAFVLVAPPVKSFLHSPRGITAARWLGVVGLAGFVALVLTVGLDDPFVFRGGTLLNAALVWMVIACCVSPGAGLVTRFLGQAPFIALGKVTYTIYLVHLPIFLLLDAERTGLEFWPLLGARLAVTAPLVLISYHLIEAPFRTGARLRPAKLVGVFALPALAVVALANLVPVHTSEVIDLTAIKEDDRPFVPETVEPLGGAPVARVLLVGDSITWTMFSGLEQWNQQNEAQIAVDAHFAVACTLAEAGTVRSLGKLEEPVGACERLRSDLPGTLEDGDYDAIVVTLGGKDLSDRFVEGEWRHLGDPVFDEWLRPQIGTLADLVAAEGVPVLWSTVSHVRIAEANNPTSDWRTFPDNDPARVDRLNELIVDEIGGRPGFTILPVDDWLHTLPEGEFSTNYRADGVHYTVTGSKMFADWLVPQILAEVGPVDVAPPASVPPEGVAPAGAGAPAPAP
jgi:peptidoglycan/LPS O-acetylase OafA/YrhL